MKKFITLGILIMLVGLMAFTPVIFKAHSSKNTLVHNCGPDFDIQNLGGCLIKSYKNSNSPNYVIINLSSGTYNAGSANGLSSVTLNIVGGSGGSLYVIDPHDGSRLDCVAVSGSGSYTLTFSPYSCFVFYHIIFEPNSGCN